MDKTNKKISKAFLFMTTSLNVPTFNKKESHVSYVTFYDVDIENDALS